MTKLKNWSITVRVDGDAYTAPECQDEYFALQGLVEGHPQHHEGKEVITSQILALRLIPGTTNGEAKTLSRWYQLEGVSQEWLDWLDEGGFSMWDYLKDIPTEAP